LERELSFYRQQAAHAIADRDSTAWECEQLRERNAELTSKAQDADRRAEAATVERATAERRLKEAESVIAGLRDAAAQAEAIPGLRADLRRATTRCEELQQSLSGLEKELQKERRASEAAEAAAESAASDALARAEEFAAAQRAEAEAVQALQSELAEVTRQKVDALMRLSDAEMVRSRADGEVVRLREKLAAAEEQLVQATAEKVQALMRVADADSIARTEGHDGGITPGKGTPHASPKKPAAKTPERRSWFGGASTAVPSEG